VRGFILVRAWFYSHMCVVLFSHATSLLSTAMMTDRSNTA
jgi:hypothetical protein